MYVEQNASQNNPLTSTRVHENTKLKREEVRPTKLVYFEGIAKHFNINIKIYEPKTNSKKGPW